MSIRLNSLCALIEKTDSFIDVGCDHGYAVEFVCKNKLADKITACDISQPSLNKAKKLLEGYDGVNYVCADGSVAAAGHSTVLISGMGGLEIVKIIGGCSPQVFILSPQSHAYEVRRTLLERDYRIVYDRVIFDGKYYDIIKAERGGGLKQSKSVTPVMLNYGIYVGEHNPALCDKLNCLLNAVNAYPKTPQNELKSELIKEALRCQSVLNKQ